eukprot:SAG11_NODE_235_length_11852_cov_4.266020_9_plen_145_part_00
MELVQFKSAEPTPETELSSSPIKYGQRSDADGASDFSDRTPPGIEDGRWGSLAASFGLHGSIPAQEDENDNSSVARVQPQADVSQPAAARDQDDVVDDLKEQSQDNINVEEQRAQTSASRAAAENLMRFRGVCAAESAVCAFLA